MNARNIASISVMSMAIQLGSRPAPSTLRPFPNLPLCAAELGLVILEVPILSCTVSATWPRISIVRNRSGATTWNHTAITLDVNGPPIVAHIPRGDTVSVANDLSRLASMRRCGCHDPAQCGPYSRNELSRQRSGGDICHQGDLGREARLGLDAKAGILHCACVRSVLPECWSRTGARNRSGLGAGRLEHWRFRPR